MNKSRLEAFSDGVIAIIITIMVLEFKVPHASSLSDLWPLWPVLLSYALSFVNVGIYWTNHHHLMHAVKQVNGAVLWANLNLLFWLSLMPFFTAWMGENHFSGATVSLYCLELLVCALAYIFLQSRCIRHDGSASMVHKAVGSDLKGRVSLAGHVLAFAVAVAGYSLAAGLLLCGIAFLWLVPDKRIEVVVSGAP